MSFSFSFEESGRIETRTEMAVPTVPATPTATQSVTPKADEQQKKKSGKQLWAIVQEKLHLYHAATHEFEHRAKEKVSFSLAEKALTATGAIVSARLVTHPEVVEVAPRGLAKVGNWVKKATGKVGDWFKAEILLKKTPAAEAVAHAAAEHAHPSHPILRGLHGLHILIPLLGAYLIAHMAMHDLQRAKREWHERRALATTALFAVGFACDAFDAVAHVVIALCLIIDAGLFDHHLEHELHSLTLNAALVACASMMVGEAIAAAHGGHAHKEKHH